MAFNFSAQQFESAFEPKRLRNWEVTNKCAMSTRKRSKFRENHKLANESIHKNSVQSEKSTVSDNKPANNILSSWEKRSSHIPITNNWVEIDPVTHSPHQTRENEARLSVDRLLDSSKQATPKILMQRSLSVQELTSAQKLKSNTPNRGEPVLRNAYSNLIKAKNVRRNDQEHHTLADAIEWPENNRNKESTSAPNLDIDTTAVGYKVYQSPSATQCSKLKVFRPKTASIISSDEKENKPTIERPKTTSRLQRRSLKSLNEMDLAIYWDVPPDLETNEKPPTSRNRRASGEPTSNAEKKDDICIIDTFSQPPTPKVDEPLCPEVNQGHDSSRRAAEKKSSDLVPELPKLEQLIQDTNVSTARSSAELSKRSSSKTRPKSATRSPTEMMEPKKRINVGVQVGGIDLRKMPQQCVAESSRNAVGKCADNTNAYKMAFKAGKLNNFSINDALFERMAKSKNLRVPKPKTPFAKKNYAIRTLMPPFSIWPQTTGYDYPDHWRLASVYQHAYKPLEARKSPFMKTVFQ